MLKQEGHPAHRPQRQVPHARGRDRRAGRPLQGASPSRPTWPAAAPTSSSAATPSSWRAPRSAATRRRPSPAPSTRTRPSTKRRSPSTRRSATPRRSRSSPPAACTSSAPSATSRAASTTSCVAAPAVRAIPGSSRFYLSLEDDLLRIFGAERITGLMERLGMEEDVPIEHGLVNRAIENAQRKVEGHNFDIRKNLLDYDDVMNQQRKAIYALRKQILEGRYSARADRGGQEEGQGAAAAAGDVVGRLDHRLAGREHQAARARRSSTASSPASPRTRTARSIPIAPTPPRRRPTARCSIRRS